MNLPKHLKGTEWETAAEWYRAGQADAREELRGKVEKMKFNEPLNSNAVAYNQALKGVIKLLESYETNID